MAPSNALFTDLYQLTMAQTYWSSGVTGEATFSLFFREFPENRAYYVFVGLQDALDYLQDFKFSNEDIAALRTLDLFENHPIQVVGRCAAVQGFEISIQAGPDVVTERLGVVVGVV